MNTSINNELSFFRRLYIYQKERFPLIGHGIMITAFTFSAISYSRICRGQTGFIGLSDFLIGVFATLTLFILVRIFDEFKDQEEDRKYRSYLPVPRGLISLGELRTIGIIIGVLQLAVIGIFQPDMLYLYVIVLAYLFLMGVEFFVPKWLKQRQMIYIASHMLIIPLIDIYSSGLDWLLDGEQPHLGLAWFFAVSFLNGFVLEFGRKLRAPESEEEGVVSYTGLYGTKGGTLIWIGLMFLTMLIAIGASMYANLSWIAVLIFGVCFLIFSLPGWLFLKNAKPARAKYIEYASGGWTILMYISLGAIPMLNNLIA